MYMFGAGMVGCKYWLTQEGCPIYPQCINGPYDPICFGPSISYTSLSQHSVHIGWITVRELYLISRMSIRVVDTVCRFVQIIRLQTHQTIHKADYTVRKLHLISGTKYFHVNQNYSRYGLSIHMDRTDRTNRNSVPWCYNGKHGPYKLSILYRP